MSAKNQQVTEEHLKKILDDKLQGYPTKKDLKKILEDYPTKDYLEERLELLKKEILVDVDEKFDNFEGKMDQKFERLQKNILSALGSTVVSHEQRIVKLEETLFPQPK